MGGGPLSNPAGWGTGDWDGGLPPIQTCPGDNPVPETKSEAPGKGASD